MSKVNIWCACVQFLEAPNYAEPPTGDLIATTLDFFLYLNAKLYNLLSAECTRFAHEQHGKNPTSLSELVSTWPRSTAVR